MSAPVIRRVIVRGTVQGVGFRALSRTGHAHQCGLAGWVRNRRDGSVEAVLAGPADGVDAALAARQRPSSAKVTAVQVNEAGEHELRERLAGEVFSMLRTV